MRVIKPQPHAHHHIFALIREASCLGFSNFIGKPATVTEVAVADDYVYGYLMSLSLLHCSLFDATLKCHYALPQAVEFCAHAQGKAATAISEADARQFMKFLNHHQITAMTQLCQPSPLAFETSKPVTVPGFDEVFFSDDLRPQELRDYWQLESPLGSLVMSTSVMVKDIEAFWRLAQVFQTQRTTGR